MSRFDRIVRRQGEPGATGGTAPARPRLNSRRKRRLPLDRAKAATLESLAQPLDFTPVFEAAAALERAPAEQPTYELNPDYKPYAATVRERFRDRIAQRAHERAAARGDQS